MTFGFISIRYLGIKHWNDRMRQSDFGPDQCGIRTTQPDWAKKVVLRDKLSVFMSTMFLSSLFHLFLSPYAISFGFHHYHTVQYIISILFDALAVNSNMNGIKSKNVKWLQSMSITIFNFLQPNSTLYSRWI